MRLAILVGARGRGTNMRAILQACRTGHIPATGALVISQSENVPAVEAARTFGADVALLHPDDPGYAEELVAILGAERIDLLCLAGYTRLLPTEVLRALPDAILNIHPALLPKYGGKGMYGMKVHEAVLDSGDTETGCTVHLVNESYDEGRILLQMKCPVELGDDPERLAARVLELEHKCYVEAIRAWLLRKAGASAVPPSADKF